MACCNNTSSLTFNNAEGSMTVLKTVHRTKINRTTSIYKKTNWVDMEDWKRIK